jgi:phosphotransferase system enzyme I (PtsI)
MLNVNSFFDTAAKIPSLEEQYQVYCGIMKAMASRPVTFIVSGWRRRCIAGKDEYIPSPECPDIKLALSNPDILKARLRALMTAGTHGCYSIVLPMVRRVDEVIKFKELVKEVQAALENEGIPFVLPDEIGIMADVPAVLAALDNFCFESRFFMSGDDTINCLYAGEAAGIATNCPVNYFDSAYLSYLQELVDKVHHRRKRVGISSAMVNEPAAIPLLLGIGFDEVVAAPGKIDSIRTLIRRVDINAAKLIASKAKSFWDPEKSLKYCRDNLVKLLKYK